MVIPCEGGLGYRLGRRVTVQRRFEQRYKTSYKWHIESDHVNQAREIIAELDAQFDVTDLSYFPTRLPFIDVNLLIGLTCTHRSGVGASGNV